MKNCHPSVPHLLPSNFTRSIIFIGLVLILAACSDDDDHNPPPAGPNQSMDLLLIAENLSSPIGLVPSPDDSGNLYVIDQVGKVWIINDSGTLLQEPFLDVTNRMVPLNTNYDERGLLGLAFHPEYSTNGRIFVYYTAPPNAGGPGEGWNNISRISEFTVSATNPDQVNQGSEKIILEIDQPQGNHQGGTIAFSPEDNYLYISIGDGGAANDVAPGHVTDWYEANEGGNGQDIEANLLGNILRIDVDSGDPYGIPADNPFVASEGRDEIFAYGFRNPFRFSFDMEENNRLFVGDAGQNLWEEISLVENGGNYGWNVKEATHCFDASNNENVLPSCPEIDIYGNELIDPIIEMNNASNPQGGLTVTIIGGYVYRGEEVPELDGQYIFGSFSKDFEPTGEVFKANPTGSGLWNFEELNFKSSTGDIGYYLKGFGQDLNGEIYLAVSSRLGPDGNTGRIYKIAMVDDE